MCAPVDLFSYLCPDFFNMFSFPFHNVCYQVQEVVFHYTFLTVEFKYLEAPGNGVSMKHILTFICSKREAWSFFIPHQIVKSNFYCQLF